MIDSKPQSFWNAVAYGSLGFALAFALVRWRFAIHTLSRSDVMAEQTSVPRDVRHLSLPEPKFSAPPMRFEVVKSPPGTLIEWADNGTALSVFGGGQQAREYTLLLPNGEQKTYKNLAPAERISLSQGGKLFRYTSSYMGSPGFRRYGGGFGAGYDALLPAGRTTFSFARRFTDEGAYIGLQVQGETQEMAEYIDGKLVRKIFSAPMPYTAVERSPEGIWFLYCLPRVRSERPPRLVKSSGASLTEIELPIDTGTVRCVAMTNSKVIITLSLGEGKTLRDQAFELQGSKMNPRPIPAGLRGVLIQKITKDGFELGNAEIGMGQHIPIVLKDGKVYDLRRLPNWPNEWVDTYVAGANRRGDLLVGTSMMQPDGTPQFRMLRRLGSQ